jgi:hypothetical protein
MNRRLLRSLLPLLLIFVLFSLASAALTSTAALGEASALQPAPGLSNQQSFPNCRYGATPTDPEQMQALDQLNAGWYINFKPYPYEDPYRTQAEFTPLIWIQQILDENGFTDEWYSWPALDQRFAEDIWNNTGRVYLVGNEVGRLGQGQMQPHKYAEAFHDISTFIKQNDPTARIAISGLVQVTPMRLQYLDLVWDAYQRQYGRDIPVDVWNMHLYVLPEVEEKDGQLRPSNAGVALGTDIELGMRRSSGSPTDCMDPHDDIYCRAEHDSMAIFERQVQAMRQWMKDHGQQNKPLIISEYSILWRYRLENGRCLEDEFGNCFDPNRVSDFMRYGFDYLNNATDPRLGYPLDGDRLVQQWMWFSLHNGVNATGGSSNLLSDDWQQLNAIGRTFRDYVAAEPLAHNLVIDRIPLVRVASDQITQAGVNLTVEFRNSGNGPVQQPFTVSFYADEARTQLIGSTVIEAAVAGCATRSYTAGVRWSDLQQGRNDFWIELDSQRQIQEGPEGDGDNIGQGAVIVYERRTVLPLVLGG